MNKLLNKLLTDPLGLIAKLWHLTRGSWYIIYYRLTKKNVRIQFPFYAQYRFKVIGPGSVFMGKNCVVCLNTFEGLTIVTDSPESTVLIGDRGHFGGVTIRCKGIIVIKDRALFAHCLIQDVPIFNQQSVNLKPIIIEDNVWLSTQTAILGGAKIGKDAVISTGCTCSEEIKPGNLIMYGFKRQLDISKLKALCS